MTDNLSKAILLAAEKLKSFGAKEVYVFGSAAEGTMRDDSDIDMAVAGLPPGVFFEAMGEAASFLDRPLDLVDLDEKNLLTDYLKTKGKLKRVA